jgi:hypothetical protein
MRSIPPLPKVTLNRAQRLLANPKYSTDIDLVTQLGNAISAHRARYPIRIRIPSTVSRISLVEATDAAQVVLALLEEKTEVFQVTYPARTVLSDMGQCLRVGPGRVVHVQEAVSVAIKVLGVFLAYAGQTPLLLLLLVWSGLSVVDIAKNFQKLYEQLEDPHERLVFETVYRLQNQLSVVNYQALQSRNYSTAFGKIAPTTEDICLALKRKISSDNVRAILRHLETRGILTKRLHRWSIRFW